MFEHITSFMNLFSSSIAHAAIVRKYPNYTPPPDGGAPVTTVGDVIGVVVLVIDLAQVVFWILAAGFGLYGAYLYLFSQGSKESLTKAKNMMIYTVVAIALALVAYGIPAVINNFFSYIPA